MRVGRFVVTMVCAGLQAAVGQATPHATGAMRVSVVDGANAAISGAEIVLPTFDVKFAVPSGGTLVIRDVAPGMYVVQARRVGYALVTRLVKVGADTTAIRFVLQPSATPLDTVTVNATPTGRIAEFERRRHLGLGQFFTGADIASSNSADLASFLRRAHGVLVKAGNPDIVTLLRDTRCGAMPIYLDGILINPGDATVATILAAQAAGRDGRLPDPQARTTAPNNPPTNPPSGTGGPPSGSTSGNGSTSGSTSGGTSGSGSRGGAPPRPTPTAAMLAGPAGSTVDVPATPIGSASTFDINSIPLSLVAGIEVYTDVGSMPPGYPPSQCGAIFLWSK